MELFAQMKSFNPKLTGKAVHIKGFDIEGEHWDRVFLVKNVAGEYIDLINCQGKEIKSLHMENFEQADDGLKLIVLEAN
jgi:hypothetical protein